MKTEWNYREIKLDRKRPEQLYYQLADGLGRLIRSHAQPGTLLPSALELSALLGINRATVLQAKVMLKDKKMMASEIADHLNFPSPSAFGMFFKRETGMTPGEYRAS